MCFCCCQTSGSAPAPGGDRSHYCGVMLVAVSLAQVLFAFQLKAPQHRVVRLHAAAFLELTSAPLKAPIQGPASLTSLIIHPFTHLATLSLICLVLHSLKGYKTYKSIYKMTWSSLQSRYLFCILGLHVCLLLTDILLSCKRRRSFLPPQKLPGSTETCDLVLISW